MRLLYVKVQTFGPTMLVWDYGRCKSVPCLLGQYTSTFLHKTNKIHFIIARSTAVMHQKNFFASKTFLL